jgi:hypothetical protein
MPACWDLLLDLVSECVRAYTLAAIGLCSKALRHPNNCLVAVTYMCYRRWCTCTGCGWLWGPSPRALRTPTEAPAARGLRILEASSLPCRGILWFRFSLVIIRLVFGLLCSVVCCKVVM